MAMPTKQVSEAGLFVFKEQYEHLKFLKRQTWTITNYIALIYAAIFSAEHLASNTPLPTSQVIILKVAAIVAALFGLFHLIVIESSMLQTRNQISKSINWIFGPYKADVENERLHIAGPDDKRLILARPSILAGTCDSFSCWGFNRYLVTGELAHRSTPKQSRTVHIAPIASPQFWFGG